MAVRTLQPASASDEQLRELARAHPSTSLLSLGPDPFGVPTADLIGDYLGVRRDLQDLEEELEDERSGKADAWREAWSARSSRLSHFDLATAQTRSLTLERTLRALAALDALHPVARGIIDATHAELERFDADRAAQRDTAAKAPDAADLAFPPMPRTGALEGVLIDGVYFEIVDGALVERPGRALPAGPGDREPEATVAEELERKTADTTRP